MPAKKAFSYFWVQAIWDNFETSLDAGTIFYLVPISAAEVFVSGIKLSLISWA
jgi:hypothetical protein